jgi:hypothetical protein
MPKVTDLLSPVLVVAMLIGFHPTAHSAGFTTPGTVFKGVRISTRDAERKLFYSLSIDSGEVVQGKRGFFKFGILPEIRIHRLKLVLRQGTSLKAIATLLKEGNLLGKQAGKMEIAHFELCSKEQGDTPLLVIKDLRLGGKKPSGTLLAQSTTHPLPTEFKALLK